MARKRIYRSRLARKESKRMVRQSVLLILLTIGIIGGVIYWGIPALVRFAGFLGDVKSSSQPIDQNDTIAPAIPQLSVPFEATSSASIAIDGFAEAGSTLLLFNNGNKVDEKLVDNDGSFSFTGVNLRRAGNEFTAQAVDDAGNESAVSRVFNVDFDEEPPELTVDSPEDGQSYFGPKEKVVQIVGTSEPGVKVFINDRFAFVDSQGGYKASFSLENGENVLQIRAVDKAGNETMSELTLNFTE